MFSRSNPLTSNPERSRGAYSEDRAQSRSSLPRNDPDLYLTLQMVTVIMSQLMDNFPTIQPEQCVVVMADGATGQVLLHSGLICLHDDPAAFQVFDSQNSAQEYINTRQTNDDTLEFVIYNHRKEVIAHFRPPRWKTLRRET